MLLANLPKHVVFHSLEVNTKRATPQFVADGVDFWIGPAPSDCNRELAVGSSFVPSSQIQTPGWSGFTAFVCLWGRERRRRDLSCQCRASCLFFKKNYFLESRICGIVSASLCGSFSGTSRPEVRRTHTLIRKPIRLLSRSLKTSIRFFLLSEVSKSLWPRGFPFFFESLCQVVELILRCAGIFSTRRARRLSESKKCQHTSE